MRMNIERSLLLSTLPLSETTLLSAVRRRATAKQAAAWRGRQLAGSSSVPPCTRQSTSPNAWLPLSMPGHQANFRLPGFRVRCLPRRVTSAVSVKCGAAFFSGTSGKLGSSGRYSVVPIECPSQVPSWSAASKAGEGASTNHCTGPRSALGRADLGPGHCKTLKNMSFTTRCSG